MTKQYLQELFWRVRKYAKTQYYNKDYKYDLESWTIAFQYINVRYDMVCPEVLLTFSFTFSKIFTNLILSFIAKLDNYI